MEDKNFYTIEGQKYFLKSANKYTPTVTSGGFVLPTILVNFDQYSPTVQPWHLQLYTSKKIIPISCSLAIGDGSTPLNANITSVYYNAKIGGLPGNNFQGINCLSRMIPFTDKVFFDSNNFYQYNAFYKEAIFSENDFIDPTVGIQIEFNADISSAILQNNGGSGFNLPVFDYQYDITFLYFETE